MAEDAPTLMNRIGRAVGRVYPHADRDVWLARRRLDTRGPRRDLAFEFPADARRLRPALAIQEHEPGEADRRDDRESHQPEEPILPMARQFADDRRCGGEDYDHASPQTHRSERLLRNRQRGNFR